MWKCRQRADTDSDFLMTMLMTQCDHEHPVRSIEEDYFIVVDPDDDRYGLHRPFLLFFTFTDKQFIIALRVLFMSLIFLYAHFYTILVFEPAPYLLVSITYVLIDNIILLRLLAFESTTDSLEVPIVRFPPWFTYILWICGPYLIYSCMFV